MLKIETNNPHIGTMYQVRENMLVATLKNGMMLTVEALPEELDAATYWHEETDCFDSREDAEAFANKSNNPFWWCAVKVELTNPETMLDANDTLSACNYKNGQAFVHCDYFNDMVDNCLYLLNEEG